MADFSAEEGGIGDESSPQLEGIQFLRNLLGKHFFFVEKKEKVNSSCKL